MISIISEVIYSNGRHHTTCNYPEELGLDVPEDCLFQSDGTETHRWITEDGRPPVDGEDCLCGKIQYYSSK